MGGVAVSTVRVALYGDAGDLIAGVRIAYPAQRQGDRTYMLDVASEAMSEVLDMIDPALGKQAQEEQARRRQHEKEVRGG